MRYTAIFEAQPGGGHHASCPALPGCHAEGDTLDEAVADVREAIAAHVEGLVAHGQAPPVEDLLVRPVDVDVAA